MTINEWINNFAQQNGIELPVQIPDANTALNLMQLVITGETPIDWGMIGGNIDNQADLAEVIRELRASVGSPLVASSVAGMTDVDKIYVYTGSESGYTSGNWYYYDGSAWVSGGVYNAVAVQTDDTLTLSGVPADAKATGDEITAVESEYLNNTKYVPINLTLNNGYINNNGSIANQSEANLEVYSDYFDVTPGEVLTIEFQNPNAKTMWAAVGRRGSNNGWWGRTSIVSSGSNTYYKIDYTIPDGTYKLSLTYRTYGSITSTVHRYENVYYPYPDGIELEERVEALEETIEPTKRNNIKPHVKVYSTNHRGWNGTCPENTLPAFKQSVVQGFGQVETDVRFTSDNVPVLLHDSTINRTARNADGTTISEDISISSITYAQALEYDFGIYKGVEFAGTKIPTLAQFLALCKNVGLVPYLELEGDYPVEKIEIIADVVKSSGIADNVVFISNYTGALSKMISYFPSNRFGVSPWTYDNTYLDFAKTLFNNKAEVFMHLSTGSVTSELVETLKSDNLPLEIWVADSSAILSANPYVTGYTSNNAVASDVLYDYEIT